MAEWIYFLHVPREDFTATMTDAESAAWAEHFERLKRLLADGTLVLAGPTLERIHTGLDADPDIVAGFATGELREFRVSLLRGRD